MRYLLATIGLVCPSSAVAQTIGFESIPGVGTPTDGQTISTEFQATLGVSFSLEPSGFPVLAEVGPPRTAFFGWPSCTGEDTPAPGQDVGSFFLTDDGVVSGPPDPLVVSYSSPVSAASGVILDIDADEEWTVEARDMSGQVIASTVIGSGSPGTGDGIASAWSVASASADIHSLRIVFTGSQGAGAVVGLAFDNFSPSSVGGGSFCDAGDNALATCPCSNPGSFDTGCDIQQGTGGVGLTVISQQTSPGNAVTWSGTGFPAASAPASVVIRATALDTASPVVFGDGLRCIGVPLVRLAATFASAGTAIHTHGHGTMAGTGTFHYQLWFRNTPIMFCDPTAAFNLSNGRSITW